MQKFFWLVLISFSLQHAASADEIAQKTDGSFVGDISKHRVNSFFMGEDVDKKTDTSFVGVDDLEQKDSLFAGSGFDKDVKRGTTAPFAQEATRGAEEGVLISEDVQQKTDGTFVGGGYGR
jgi:hypothetical protein